MGLRRGGPAAGEANLAAAIAAVVGLALIWAGFLWASGRGFDVTDEANYLLSIHDPTRYVGASDFGVVWAPLDRLVGGDIRLLRIAGFAVLQAFALAFGFSVVRFAGLGRPSA